MKVQCMSLPVLTRVDPYALCVRGSGVPRLSGTPVRGKSSTKGIEKKLHGIQGNGSLDRKPRVMSGTISHGYPGLVDDHVVST